MTVTSMDILAKRGRSHLWIGFFVSWLSQILLS